MKHLLNIVYRFGLAALIVALSLPLQPAQEIQASDSWWDSSWSNRERFRFNASTLSTDLIDFPLLVTVNALRADWSKFSANLIDVRFMDSDGTLLPTENVSVNMTSQLAYFYVKIPRIEAYSNYTDYID